MSSVSNTTVPSATSFVWSPTLAAASGVRPKRWTREEYHRLAEQGWFDGKRVELIGGEIVEVSPQSPEHYWSIEALRDLLGGIFPADAYWIRAQAPVRASDSAEPEPDLAVVRGKRHDALRHPTTAILAVEVSKTTQLFDKTVKAELYASIKIEDYWVLDLERRELTVMRQPSEDAGSQFGWRYGKAEVIGEAGVVSPLAAPEATLHVADMLPPSASQAEQSSSE